MWWWGKAGAVVSGCGASTLLGPEGSDPGGPLWLLSLTVVGGGVGVGVGFFGGWGPGAVGHTRSWSSRCAWWVWVCGDRVGVGGWLLVENCTVDASICIFVAFC